MVGKREVSFVQESIFQRHSKQINAATMDDDLAMPFGSPTPYTRQASDTNREADTMTYRSYADLDRLLDEKTGGGVNKIYRLRLVSYNSSERSDFDATLDGQTSIGGQPLFNQYISVISELKVIREKHIESDGVLFFEQWPSYFFFKEYGSTNKPARTKRQSENVINKTSSFKSTCTEDAKKICRNLGVKVVYGIIDYDPATRGWFGNALCFEPSNTNCVERDLKKFQKISYWPEK